MYPWLSGAHYIVQFSLNKKISYCLSPSGIIGVYYHTWILSVKFSSFMICREEHRLQRWMAVNSWSESALSQPIPIRKTLLMLQRVLLRSSWLLSPPQGDKCPKSVGLFPCVWPWWKWNHTGLHESIHCLCRGFEIHSHHWTPWCFICIAVNYLILRTYNSVHTWILRTEVWTAVSLCCNTAVKSPVWIFRCTETPPGTHECEGHFWVTG